MRVKRVGKLCSFPECGRPVYATIYCKSHYNQNWLKGSPVIKFDKSRGTIDQRFWKKVSKGTTEECWEWSGYRDKDGYGRIRSGKTFIGAHRASYIMSFGEIPEGNLVLHKCNNPPCVNPAHLRTGDHDENMQDRMAAGNYLSGENSPLRKYSYDFIVEVRSATGTFKQLQEQFNLTKNQLAHIKDPRSFPGMS